MKEMIIKVEGMVCHGCENRVKNALKNMNGVEDVIADHAMGIVKVTSNDKGLESSIAEKIEDLGFEVVKEG